MVRVAAITSWQVANGTTVGQPATLAPTLPRLYGYLPAGAGEMAAAGSSRRPQPRAVYNISTSPYLCE